MRGKKKELHFKQLDIFAEIREVQANNKCVHLSFQKRNDPEITSRKFKCMEKNSLEHRRSNGIVTE